MDIKESQVSTLLPYPENARQHGERNLSVIRASFERYGQLMPLIVQRSTNIVLGGNGRLSVVKDLGWETVSIKYVDVDDNEAAKLSVILNRSGELATWDNHSLHAILERLPDMELEDAGFSTLERDALIDWAPGETDKDKIEDYNAEKDTYLIKIEGIKTEDKDRLLGMVRDCLDGEAGLQINAY